MDGRQGVGVAETSNNTQHGLRAPHVFEGEIGNGLFPAWK
jgi:hypothetical protein